MTLERGSVKTYSVVPIATVATGASSRERSPKQGSEGAPAAWIETDQRFMAGLDGREVGQDLLVLTWLHESQRDVLRVHSSRCRLMPLYAALTAQVGPRPTSAKPVARISPVGAHAPGRVGLL